MRSIYWRGVTACTLFHPIPPVIYCSYHMTIVLCLCSTSTTFVTLINVLYEYSHIRSCYQLLVTVRRVRVNSHTSSLSHAKSYNLPIVCHECVIWMNAVDLILSAVVAVPERAQSAITLLPTWSAMAGRRCAELDRAIPRMAFAVHVSHSDIRSFIHSFFASAASTHLRGRVGGSEVLVVYGDSLPLVTSVIVTLQSVFHQLPTGHAHSM